MENKNAMVPCMEFSRSYGSMHRILWKTREFGSGLLTITRRLNCFPFALVQGCFGSNFRHQIRYKLVLILVKGSQCDRDWRPRKIASSLV